MNQSKPFKRDNNPMKRGIVIAGLAAGAVGILASVFWSGDRGEGTAVAVAVKVPASLSVKAQTGKSVFDENCAVCHGANREGKRLWPQFWIKAPALTTEALFADNHAGDGHGDHDNYSEMPFVENFPQLSLCALTMTWTERRYHPV